MAEKEGVDYKLVPMKDSKGGIVKDGKGNPVKTRKFFTRAEKAAMKAPKVEAKAAPKAKPVGKAKAVVKVTEKPVSKNAMTGYRAGDVTTTSLDKPKVGRGNGTAEVKRRKTDSFVNTMKTTLDKAPNRAVKPQTAAEKRLAETTANLAEVDARVKSRYPDTTNPAILGARKIRNLFTGKGGLSDRKNR